MTAAGLSLKNFHANPFQDELNAFLSKASWAHGTFSDCLAIYNAYFVRMKECFVPFKKVSSRTERSLYNSNFLARWWIKIIRFKVDCVEY